MTESDYEAEILLYSGRMVRPLQLRPEDVDIRDIAHSLALTCRFNGHCIEHYSVAQHSVLLSRIVHPALALEALMHDAGEAYIHDVVKPLKPLYRIGGHSFNTVEDRLLGVILKRFCLPPRISSAVMIADSELTTRELNELVRGRGRGNAIHPWPWRQAEASFLSRFFELTQKTADTAASQHTEAMSHDV